MADPLDESPYPRIFEPTGRAYPGGVYLVKQDSKGPPDVMRMIRKMIAHADGSDSYYLGLELFRRPPREYPPMQAGDQARAIGVQLSRDEAAALWASLGEFLVESTVQDT